MQLDMSKVIKNLVLILSCWLCMGMIGLAEEAGEIPEVLTSISELQNVTCKFITGTEYDYTGREIKPEVASISFVDAEGILQERSTEGYTIVEYKNNTNIGKADIVISIQGYEGTLVLEDVFTIRFGSMVSLKTSPYSYKTIQLTWKKVAGADGYEICRKVSGSKKYTLIKTISNGSTTSYNDSSSQLKLGTTYEYRARAYRIVEGKKVYGSYTSAVKQKLQVATVKISSSKALSYNSIKIEWGKIYGASGYVVYRSMSEKGSYEKIATVKSGTSYTGKKLKCGETYYYKVCAYRTVKGKNYYGYGSKVVAVNTRPEKIDFNKNTLYGANEITLKWNKSPGAQGYQIYRSTDSKSGYKLVKTITKGSTTSWKNAGLDKNTVYYYKIRPYCVVKKQTVYGWYSSVYKKELVLQKISDIQKYTTVKYVSGGRTTNGWDCSGFTQWALKYIAGVNIPKVSSQQAKAGKAVDKKNMSKWKPGDVLVYSSNGRVCHVGLYLGNGKMMHALNKKHGTIIQDVTYYEKWDSGTTLTGVRRYY